MLRVVLDTNVIISALHSKGGNPALIVSIVMEDRIRLCLTNEIFAEYREVLARKYFKYLDQPVVKRMLTRLGGKSLWVCPKKTIDIIKDDPEDNKFLECAEESKADFLVTGNKKHFPFGAFHGARIVTPKEFVHLIAKMLLNYP